MQNTPVRMRAPEDGAPVVRNKGYVLCVLLILAATLFQKIALPGTSGVLPITTIILPILVVSGWCLGLLLIDIYAFFALVAFLTSASISLYLNGGSTKVSFGSIALFTMVQSVLIFRRPSGAYGFSKAAEFFRNWMYVLAILGIAQYALQYIISAKFAFALDYYLPSDMIVKIYNNLNPLFYGSQNFKSNGVFFAEPSVFSQFIGVALVYELATSQKMRRIAIFLVALLCTFSGTGIIVVFVFGTYQVLKRISFKVILTAGALALIVITLGGALQIDALTERVTEFATPNSSGHARFISIFGLLDAVTFTNVTWAFFGTGPGTISSYFLYLPYAVFDPTWGKILFEYGLIGATSYAVYFIMAVKGPDNPARGPLTLSFFVLGGYFLDGSMLTLVAVLVAFQKQPSRYLVPTMAIPGSFIPRRQANV